MVYQIKLAKATEIFQLATLDEKVSMTPWSYDNYLSSFNNPKHKIYLLIESNQIIGAIVISQALDEAEILQFWIKKEFHENGYGKILLQYTIDILKKNSTKQIFLEVRSDNIRAISLYTKLGFIPVGKRENYYKVDTWFFDAIIMLKNV